MIALTLFINDPPTFCANATNKISLRFRYSDEKAQDITAHNKEFLNNHAPYHRYYTLVPGLETRAPLHMFTVEE